MKRHPARAAGENKEDIYLGLKANGVRRHRGLAKSCAAIPSEDWFRRPGKDRGRAGATGMRIEEARCGPSRLGRVERAQCGEMAEGRLVGGMDASPGSDSVPTRRNISWRGVFCCLVMQVQVRGWSELSGSTVEPHRMT
jgi:hypothetical protein